MTNVISFKLRIYVAISLSIIFNQFLFYFTTLRRKATLTVRLSVSPLLVSLDIPNMQYISIIMHLET